MIDADDGIMIMVCFVYLFVVVATTYMISVLPGTSNSISLLCQPARPNLAALARRLGTRCTVDRRRFQRRVRCAAGLPANLRGGIATELGTVVDQVVRKQLARRGPAARPAGPGGAIAASTRARSRLIARSYIW